MSVNKRNRKRKIKKLKIGRIIFLLLIIILGIIFFKKNIVKSQLIENGYSAGKIEKILEKFGNAECSLSEEYNEYLIQIINDDNFLEDNLCKYVEVFNNKSNIKYKSSLMAIINDKYYISKNVHRYIDYYESNNELTPREIVENVNCNLDKHYYSNVNIADLSKDELILVNKYYELKSDYIPSDLIKIDKKYGYERLIKKEVYDAFIEMSNSIRKEGMNIYIVSPYRSYSYQNNLYNSYVEKNGINKADTFSARAGFSEHQTGLAIDISDGNKSYTYFGETSEYKWMLKNSYRYGFILRYPQGKEKQTGYMFESWHYRYVGVEVATYIKENNITFDEYYEFFLNK